MPLQASASFHTSDGRVAQLGISDYLVRLLTRWSTGFDDFPSYYNNLQFGEEIIVEEITLDFQREKVRVAANARVELLLSFSELQSEWQLHLSSWPDLIELKDLELVSMLNENVGLIKSKRHFKCQDVILKSSPRAPKLIYHELRMLLTLPSHTHLAKPPLAIVSIPDPRGGEPKIVGFILHYYPLGSLGRSLRDKSLGGTLNWHDQIRWAKQITSTLIFLNDTAQTFYSDLKPDNILLSTSENSRTDEIILIDFEQNGAPNAWTAPEVIHLQTLNLLSNYVPDDELREA
jgi:hypothetical protein